MDRISPFRSSVFDFINFLSSFNIFLLSFLPEFNFYSISVLLLCCFRYFLLSVVLLLCFLVSFLPSLIASDIHFLNFPFLIFNLLFYFYSLHGFFPSFFDVFFVSCFLRLLLSCFYLSFFNSFSLSFLSFLVAHESYPIYSIYFFFQLFFFSFLISLCLKSLLAPQIRCS